MTRSFNAWSSNTFQTRDDVARGLLEVFEPLVPAFSEGGSRVRLAETGASFTMDAAELEGFARPLWGIVPFVHGGGDFKYWELYRRGVTNGTDPSHKEYWGEVSDFGQQLVEMASLGYAMCFATKDFWDPLTESAKKNLANYLLEVREKQFCNTNWKFFRVLIDLGLETVGVPFDSKLTERTLNDIDDLYLADGWYGDGFNNRIDYYNPFAFHFYGLIYVIVKRSTDPERCKRFLSRSLIFAEQFIHWFSNSGASLPYGRSLTYRFASVAFWGILPCALSEYEEPIISWGVMKGIFLRNLQWWSEQPISIFGSNILSVGYSYPNLFMSERYNSPQSPYWALKVFAPLMLSESHPFWKSNIEPLVLENKTLKSIGMIITHQKANTTALIGGPWSDEYHNEKYTKFAYSTRYGFGINSNPRTFALAHLDNMIGLSFNEKEFFTRQEYKGWIFEGGLYSEWAPVKDIFVKTWILQRDDYHIRIHKIDNKTCNKIFTIEGGFAISSVDKKRLGTTTGEEKKFNYAKATSEDDHSMIVDLHGNRLPFVCQPEPNTNIISSKVLLPELKGTIEKDSSAVFSCAISCSVSSIANSNQLFQSVFVPEIDALEKLKASAERVLCN